MKRLQATLLALGLTAAASVPGALAWKQVPIVRHTVEADIAASPDAIWSAITTGKNLVTWCPEWKSLSNAKINVTRVGDVLDFTDAWGNGGRSVVTFVARNQELRVQHEPTNGSYICQAKLLIAPTKTGARVTYVEQYSDESAPADLAATAGKVDAEMTATLAALKKSVALQKRAGKK
jgi:uncharacterized protein YndB with AHSA1/START domain